MKILNIGCDGIRARTGSTVGVAGEPNGRKHVRPER